jgi:hypothetical protein
MLPASAGGEQGALLTPFLFQAAVTALRLEFQAFDAPPDSLLTPTSYSSLRLVAMRLDPCFGGSDAQASTCEAQVRVIFQPIVPDATGKGFLALDAATHVFFKLSKAELLTFTKAIVALRDASGGYTEGPLGPHPLLVKEGLGGAFGKGLSQLVTQTLGASRISRVTVFARMNKNQDGVSEENQLFDWRFAVVDGAGTPLKPKNIEQAMPFQGLVTRGDARAASPGNPPPPPPPPPPSQYGSPSFNTPGPTSTPPETESLVKGEAGLEKDDADKLPLPTTDELGTTVDNPLEIAVLRTSLRMENPLAHTPDTTDCASCHLAQPLRARGEGLGMKVAAFGDLFTGTKRSLDSASPKTTNLRNLHAFSYVGKEFAVNQRTVNESALVADALELALIK